MTKKTKPQLQTAVRLPEALVQRIDRHVGHLNRNGLQITRSDVIRLAASQGMDVIEKQRKEGK